MTTPPIPTGPDTALPPATAARRGGRHRLDRAGQPHPQRPRPAGRGTRAAALTSFTVVAAAGNAAAYHWGLVPVGFGLHATASTAAVAVIALLNTWLREVGGQRLVLAAIAVATIASACAGGAFGVAWGIAYLVAEIVGACTWRPLRDLGAHDGQAAVALGLTSLIGAWLYVTLLRTVVDASVAGQLLGTAEAVLVTFGVAAPIRAAWRHRQHSRRHRSTGEQEGDSGGGHG